MSEESHREARQVRKIEGQRRGSTVYVFDDQAYVKDRQYNEKLYVRCHLFKSGCHGRGHINLENSTMMVTKDSQASYIEQMELKSHVYDERCARAPASAATSVSFESVRRTLLNERNKYLPPAPASPLEAADFLASNTMFQSFYKGVATYNDNLALIMYEDGIEDIVMHVEEMAMDATFSVVPAIFEQHLTIFGRFGDNFLPMFHVLMTSRQGELYTAVLDRIKSQLPGLDPTIVHSDFEVAIHNAIADKIEKGLQLLRNSKPQIPRQQAAVDSLVEYYNNFWLRRIGVDRLSVWGQVHRTNNSCESYHAVMSKDLKPKTRFWTFIEYIKRKALRFELDVVRVANGVSVTRQQGKTMAQQKIEKAN
ncbi:hypothetical protein O3P69_017561 [Scylla paramamosain]|uniref:MULE transposase domain-containing protein n=1 Tax=Scylla paramamosain TaxID=85552 RepID=A0AAW0TWA9_SCYPA